MHIQAILFDLDGTLANTLPLCIEIYKQTMLHFTDRQYSDEEITSHFGLSEEGIFRRLLPDKWPEALDYYITHYKEQHYLCPQPFPGILNALQQLKERKVQTGVITGKGRATAEYTLQYLGLAPFFDELEVGQANAIVKAKAIDHILDKWHIKPENAAYIGDTDTDMLEAATAGVFPLAAAWAHTHTIERLESLEPLATFNTVEQFEDWIKTNIK